MLMVVIDNTWTSISEGPILRKLQTLQKQNLISQFSQNTFLKNVYLNSPYAWGLGCCKMGNFSMMWEDLHQNKESGLGEKKYRAGVIGLGWMGFLYDLGRRDYENIGGSHENPIYDVESADRL